MNDGHCMCGGLFMLVQDGNIQKWACYECKRIGYRPYNVLEIFQTYQEAENAMKGAKR